MREKTKQGHVRDQISDTGHFTGEKRGISNTPTFNLIMSIILVRISQHLTFRVTSNKESSSERLLIRSAFLPRYILLGTLSSRYGE